MIFQGYQLEYESSTREQLLGALVTLKRESKHVDTQRSADRRQWREVGPPQVFLTVGMFLAAGMFLSAGMFLALGIFLTLGISRCGDVSCSGDISRLRYFSPQIFLAVGMFLAAGTSCSGDVRSYLTFLGASIAKES